MLACQRPTNAHRGQLEVNEREGGGFREEDRPGVQAGVPHARLRDVDGDDAPDQKGAAFPKP